MARNSVARPPVPTASKPITAPQTQRLMSELEGAQLATERLFSLLNMVVESLYRRCVDDDHGLAICLENAAELELNPARQRIEAALELVAQVRSAVEEVTAHG